MDMAVFVTALAIGAIALLGVDPLFTWFATKWDGRITLGIYGRRTAMYRGAFKDLKKGIRFLVAAVAGLIMMLYFIFFGHHEFTPYIAILFLVPEVVLAYGSFNYLSLWAKHASQVKELYANR